MLTSPAPINRYFFSDNFPPMMRMDAKIPAKATDAVPACSAIMTSDNEADITLYVVIESEILVAILCQKSKRIVIGKIFELNQRIMAKSVKIFSFDRKKIDKCTS